MSHPDADESTSSGAAYLAASQAASQLGVSIPTLYAYVSRGFLRSQAGSKGRRTRLYDAEDIARLKARKEARRDPTGTVRKALTMGMPVLDSAITLIADGRLYYRGHDAVQLALTGSIEEVAGLIWTETLNALPSEAFAGQARRWVRSLNHNFPELGIVDSLQILLPLAAAEDSAAFDLRQDAVARTGARILKLLAQIAAKGRGPAAPAIARTLQEGWAPRNAAATRIINAALILCVDHELNVSSFTARCVASAAASPYDVVLAGLSALKGSKHGGATARVDAFLREVDGTKRIRSGIAQRLRRGENIPGFGHPLYPRGDPRARTLLDLISEAGVRSRVKNLISAVAAEMHAVIGEYPNVDFALTAIAWALELPPGAALAMFAVGRTVGWIGHAIEQYNVDQLIRPRARYVGPLPAQ
jgi:citrate synthase